MLAVSVRNRLKPAPGFSLAPRVAAVAEELEALACDLEDEGLELDPACAVSCLQLLTDSSESLLLNDVRPAEDTRARIRRIRGGFAPAPPPLETSPRSVASSRDSSTADARAAMGTPSPRQLLPRAPRRRSAGRGRARDRSRR